MSRYMNINTRMSFKVNLSESKKIFDRECQ